MVRAIFPAFHFLSRRHIFIKSSASHLLLKSGRFRAFPKFLACANFSSSGLLLNKDNSDYEEEDEDEKELFNLDLLADIAKLYKHPDSGHNLYLIQPKLKYGPKRDSKEVSELKMAEAVALVQTLKAWKIVKKSIVPIKNADLKILFGKGNLEELKMQIRSDPKITGVFICINMLTALQNAELERAFGVQVFDRYQIVLRIFHEHARTKESRLQIALAEIPYLKVKLRGFHHTGNLTSFQEIGHVGGSGETYMEMRRRLLFERELKIKRALQKLEKQRHFLRSSPYRKELPIVAVVGYTNCGKTTLIRSLTDDLSLVPEDKLFATLDVTLHAGLLPSSQKVLYVDTVGFISDVPTTLIQSFKCTLEDALAADLIVHVRDISHPDTEMQKKVVLQTLEELQLPQKLLDTIIEVGNKVDLLESFENTDENLIPISATEGTNLLQLAEVIENSVLGNTGRSIHLFKVASGGEEYQWLLKNAAIRDAIPDSKDMNNLIVEVVISKACLSKFKHYFGDLTISIEEIKQRDQ